jgi:hypothetical protein
MAEIAVQVAIHKKEDDIKQFYVRADENVSEFKKIVCEKFDTSMDPN